MKKLLIGVMVAAAVAALWSARREAPAPLFSDRLWIDHVPRGDRDTVQVFVALSEHSIGIFQAMSQWRGRYELFQYEAARGELRLVYPQTGEREAVRFSATRCDQGGMDFCLELSGASRGVKRYYSLEGWEVGDAHDARTLEDAIEQRLVRLR